MGPSVDGGVCVCVGRGGGEAPSIQIPIRPTKVWIGGLGEGMGAHFEFTSISL
jgi:hypothetical protein